MRRRRTRCTSERKEVEEEDRVRERGARRMRSESCALRKKKSILVMCALAEETMQMERRFQDSRLIFNERKGVDMNGVLVFVVMAGVGEVDAAVETTKMIMEMKNYGLNVPDVVMSVGCAGSHRDDLHAGDVVFSTSIVPASYKIVRPNGDHEHVGVRLGLGKASLREIVADEKLIALAESCASVIRPDRWPTPAGQNRCPQVVRGRVCSCDTYVREGTYIHIMTT